MLVEISKVVVDHLSLPVLFLLVELGCQFCYLLLYLLGLGTD